MYGRIKLITRKNIECCWQPQVFGISQQQTEETGIKRIASPFSSGRRIVGKNGRKKTRTVMVDTDKTKHLDLVESTNHPRRTKPSTPHAQPHPHPEKRGGTNLVI